jgi:hypothetical protein
MGNWIKTSQDHKKSLALGLVPPKNEGGGFEYTDHASYKSGSSITPFKSFGIYPHKQ